MATEYEKLKEEISKKVKENGGCRYSKSDMTQMTTTLLNTPEQEVKTYLKDPNEPLTTKPVERYRDSLKPVLKQFGVDNAELDKIQDVKFSKEHAEALMDVSTQVIKDYTGTGRKFVFPVNDASESQMEIAQIEKAEKEVETTKIEQQSDGSYATVPTGKKRKTKAHKEMKVSNKVPGWLIEDTML